MGMFKEKVTFGVPDPPLSHDEALTMARVFFVPEDLGTPADRLEHVEAVDLGRLVALGLVG